MANAFFDTNILLYMYGGGDLDKRSCAISLFRECAASGRVWVSTQVVQEFYAAGSRKLRMPRPELLEAVSSLFRLPLVVVGPSHIASAIELEGRYQIGFWDGLILAAAGSAGAEELYTEDLNDGQLYGTVTARNPFWRSPR